MELHSLPTGKSELIFARSLSALVEQGQPIYCGFDADPTGDATAQRMRELHPSILRLRPAAKDWNDLLRRHRC